MAALTFALTFVAALGAALAAGVFFAFSTFVMKGLDEAPPATAVGAMQGINKAAPGPPLMMLLFGTAILSLAVAVLAVLGGDGKLGGIALAAALTYLVGVVGVTIAANVPLNERLAVVDPNGAGAAAQWSVYDRRWRAWNHARTSSGLAAAVGMIAALAV